MSRTNPISGNPQIPTTITSGNSNGTPEGKKEDLFNNNMVKNALKGMSPEQLEMYQRIGERMYNSVDFTKNEILNNTEPPVEEKLAYIISGLKSGLSPRDMDEEEIKLMIEYYGDRWFEKFGITLEEIGVIAKELLAESEKYKKVGRNDKCPCGSGKKYKQCHIDRPGAVPKLVQQKALNIYEERKG